MRTAPNEYDNDIPCKLLVEPKKFNYLLAFSLRMKQKVLLSSHQLNCFCASINLQMLIV